MSEVVMIGVGVGKCERCSWCETLIEGLCADCHKFVSSGGSRQALAPTRYAPLVSWLTGAPYGAWYSVNVGSVLTGDTVLLSCYAASALQASCDVWAMFYGDTPAKSTRRYSVNGVSHYEIIGASGVSRTRLVSVCESPL